MKLKIQQWTLAAAVSIGLAGCTGLEQKPLHDPTYAPTAPAIPKPAEQNNGAIFQAGFGLNLYEDQKAGRVGDILTIVLVEETTASKSASTSTSRSSDFSSAAPTYKGVSRTGYQTATSADQDFDGAGDSSQSNSLSGSITVTVAQQMANGYLLVRGEKVVSLNEGDEFVRFSGIVRPIDIRSDNSVLSTQVGNAKISYGGQGVLADANSQGWLSRFFLKWWPF